MFRSQIIDDILRGFRDPAWVMPIPRRKAKRSNKRVKPMLRRKASSKGQLLIRRSVAEANR